jgi:hypothetical protein
LDLIAGAPHSARDGLLQLEGCHGRRVPMIFQQFLYPQTGCAAYVFG